MVAMIYKVILAIKVIIVIVNMVLIVLFMVKYGCHGGKKRSQFTRLLWYSLIALAISFFFVFIFEKLQINGRYYFYNFKTKFFHKSISRFKKIENS
jgi:hypothetical protein